MFLTIFTAQTEEATGKEGQRKAQKGKEDAGQRERERERETSTRVHGACAVTHVSMSQRRSKVVLRVDRKTQTERYQQYCI